MAVDKSMSVLVAEDYKTEGPQLHEKADRQDAIDPLWASID